MLRGHLIYNEIWEPIHGQILHCARERSNRFDPFAVSVVHSEEIMGHVPRRISAACALFLQHHGSIRCEVTGDRRHSSDLPQGGLEVPWDLIFEGEKKYIQKIKKLLTDLVKNSEQETVEGVTADTLSKTVEVKSSMVEGGLKDFEEDDRKAKRSKSDHVNDDSNVAVLSDPEDAQDKRKAVMDVDMDQRWICIYKITLNARDKFLLLENHELDDKHINASQKLLLHQFSSFQGLKNSLVQDHIGFWASNYIQIFHCRSCHWITASTRCQSGTVNIYDFLYKDIYGVTENKIEVFDSAIKFQLPKVQVQEGLTECGLLQ